MKLESTLYKVRKNAKRILSKAPDFNWIFSFSLFCIPFRFIETVPDREAWPFWTVFLAQSHRGCASAAVHVNISIEEGLPKACADARDLASTKHPSVDNFPIEARSNIPAVRHRRRSLADCCPPTVKSQGVKHQAVHREWSNRRARAKAQWLSSCKNSNVAASTDATIRDHPH